MVQITLLAIAMGAVLHRVVTTAEVGSRTILGAISVYTVLGILFTYLYGTIERIQGAPFFEGVPHPAGSDFLFFSYTTLTTTGYGDLVPGGQPGRMLSGLEMMIGQIFLVTLVAGLVSLWRPGEALRRRREEKRARGLKPRRKEEPPAAERAAYDNGRAERLAQVRRSPAITGVCQRRTCPSRLLTRVTGDGNYCPPQLTRNDSPNGLFRTV